MNSGKSQVLSMKQILESFLLSTFYPQFIPICHFLSYDFIPQNIKLAYTLYKPTE